METGLALSTCPLTPCPWCTLGVAHDATTQEVRRAWNSHYIEYINTSTVLEMENTEKMHALIFIFALRGEHAWPKPRSSPGELDERGQDEPGAKRFKGDGKGSRVRVEQAAPSWTSAASSADGPRPSLRTPWSERPADWGNSAAAPAASAFRPRWQFQGGRQRQWVDYDDFSAFSLEVAFEKRKAECYFWVGEWRYCVKMSRLPFVQISLSTGAERGVRRIGAGEPMPAE